MRRHTLMALVVASLIAADAPKEDERVKKETAKLQGVWVLHSVQWLGEETRQDLPVDQRDLIWEYYNRFPEQRETASDLEDGRTTLTIKGNKVVFHQGCRVTGEGSYKFDLTKNPKVMERKTISYRYRCCNEGCRIYSEKTRIASIYSLEEDTLRWCYGRTNTDLPTEFATKDDKYVYLFTFKRIKPC